MIRFDKNVCRNLEIAGHREWLETNGLGGFASSTITGLNTRRYHGLLVAATRPPVGRMVLLSKLEETLVISERRYDLSCNLYPGVIYPEGHLYLQEFREDPFPTFRYCVEDLEIEKSVMMVHGENTTVVRYEVRGPASENCRLELRPLVAFRDYHVLTHENGALNAALEVEEGRVGMTPYPDCPTVYLAHEGGDVRAVGEWYRKFEYAREQERGLDFQEDLFNPLVIDFDVNRNRSVSLIASTEIRSASDAPQLRMAELERRNRVIAAAPSDDVFVRRLVRAADQFIVRRGEERTVIAGYHWFSDWGRDTMIALPGLTLSTGRPEDARRILLEFAASVDRGMIPNRFPDGGETPEYNTVDATLWFFEAIRAFAASTGDYRFVRTHLCPVLADIVAWHERGTRYGIHVDTDGLLVAGEPGIQLTWMDAKVGDWVVTARTGKTVEVQALWYNALRILEELTGDRTYGKRADRTRVSFNQLFWNESTGCLYDVVSEAATDASIRPNQIFAVSLRHRMLPAEKEKAVVATVKKHLLTRYGLRSLAPSDPKYRGVYQGNLHDRDSAYHQGTVWPWLMGPFLAAYLNVNGRSRRAHKQAAEWLEELRRHVDDAGVGQIPEVFDGDAPHRAGGCIAQAWSVAEILRTMAEIQAEMDSANRDAPAIQAGYGAA
jgi:predicted glycogen debranching enzyme